MPTESTTRRNAAFALAIVWVTVPPLIGFKLLANIGAVGEWLKEDPSRGIPAYILLFAISSGLGILPTYAQAILGGWVFGLALGAPAAIAGCVGGALLGWSFSRLVSGRGIEAWLDAKPKARAIRSALVGAHQVRLMWLVALLRLPPNSPFAIANLAMASTGVRLLPFMAGTAIGMVSLSALVSTTRNFKPSSTRGRMTSSNISSNSVIPWRGSHISTMPCRFLRLTR